MMLRLHHSDLLFTLFLNKHKEWTSLHLCSSAQEGKLDDTCRLDDLASSLVDQLHPSKKGTSSGNEVVNEENPLTRLDCSDVH